MTTTANNNKKKAIVALGAASAVLAAGGAMAYFTDWVQDDFQGLNGVDVASNPVDLVINDDGAKSEDLGIHPKDDTVDSGEKHDGTSDEEITARWSRINGAVNNNNVLNVNPGDEFALPVQMYNGGDYGIDVREKIFVKSDTAFSEELAKNIEYRIRSAVSVTNDTLNSSYGTLPINGGHTFANGDIAYDVTDGYDLGQNVVADTTLGVDAITVEQVDENTIMYTIPAFTLLPGEEMVRDYYMIFDKDASNDYQLNGITIDYLVEAKQTNDVNGNTNANPNAGWKEAATGSMTFGDTTTAVVPKLN